MKKTYHFVSIVILSILFFLVASISTSHAMSQKALNNRVYLVTFINSNGYSTAHQYVFFTTNGKSAYVNVTNTDQSGQPVVTKDSTKEEKTAPRIINRYLANRAILNKAVSNKYYQIKGDQVTINNGLITKKSKGKIQKGGNIKEFVVNYPDGTQKYNRVSFQMAQKDYQYK